MPTSRIPLTLNATANISPSAWTQKTPLSSHSFNRFASLSDLLCSSEPTPMLPISTQPTNPSAQAFAVPLQAYLFGGTHAVGPLIVFANTACLGSAVVAAYRLMPDWSALSIVLYLYALLRSWLPLDNNSSRTESIWLSVPFNKHSLLQLWLELKSLPSLSMAPEKNSNYNEPTMKWTFPLGTWTISLPLLTGYWTSRLQHQINYLCSPVTISVLNMENIVYIFDSMLN